MNKTGIIFGSNGLVGSKLLILLLESGEYSKVKVFVRRELPIKHPKLEQIITDFDNIDLVSDQIYGDDIYLCLGTTMAKAGSKDAFYKVDFTYTLQAASFASKNNVKKLCLISSMGADKSSSVYYSKVKGEIEASSAALNFETTHIVRPSLLLGERGEKRVGERIGIVMSGLLKFLFIGPLAKYKPIQDKQVASAMYHLMQTDLKGLCIHESNKLQEFTQ